MVLRAETAKCKDFGNWRPKGEASGCCPATEGRIAMLSFRNCESTLSNQNSRHPTMEANKCCYTLTDRFAVGKGLV